MVSTFLWRATKLTKKRAPAPPAAALAVPDRTIRVLRQRYMGVLPADEVARRAALGVA